MIIETLYANALNIALGGVAFAACWLANGIVLANFTSRKVRMIRAALLTCVPVAGQLAAIFVLFALLEAGVGGFVSWAARWATRAVEPPVEEKPTGRMFIDSRLTGGEDAH